MTQAPPKEVDTPTMFIKKLSFVVVLLVLLSMAVVLTTAADGNTEKPQAKGEGEPTTAELREQASVVVDGEEVKLPPGHPKCPGGKCTAEMRSKCPYTRSKRAVLGVADYITAFVSDPVVEGKKLMALVWSHDAYRRALLVVLTVFFMWAFNKTLQINAVVRRREDSTKP